MAGVLSRQQQAGTSTSAADSFPAVAAADQHPRDAERQKRQSTLDKQAQPRQENKTLLMQLQLLQQELGLCGSNNHTHAPATITGTDIASALDSLAAAAAAAAAEPQTHGQQELQQHMQHMQAPQLSPRDLAHQDKLPPAKPPESGEQTDTRSRQRTLEQASNDGTILITGPVLQVQQAMADLASGDQPNNLTAAAAIRPAVTISKGSATGPQQFHQAGSAGGNNLPAQLPIDSNSRALQPQRKRARMHEAQAHHFQIAKQFQQQYQQQVRLQGQVTTHSDCDGELHRHDSGVTAQTSAHPKPHTEPPQQVLQQQVQQLLLPELNRRAIQRSLDPTTQCMVECGSASGLFSVDSERISCLCNICRQNGESHKPEFAPSEFERHGGMAACKKWRFSIKVADGGPGMTLGRWLDMRGIQISSYPSKSKHHAAKCKRQLGTVRGLGVGHLETPPGSQPDLAQLMASLNDSNTRAAGPIQAAAGSSTASAVAAVFQVLANKACSNGAATANSNDTLKQLAAAVAELLANEIPPATLKSSAATQISHQHQAGTVAATSDVPIAVVNGASPVGPPADEPSVSTCLWPVDAEDPPAGYAVAAAQALVAADATKGRQRAALQARHSLQRSWPAGHGPTQSDPDPHQQYLGLVPSRSSVSTPLQLPSLIAWGTTAVQSAQRRPIQQQQQAASRAPPAVAGGPNAIPANTSVPGSSLQPGVPWTSPDGNGASVGQRSSGEAFAGCSLPNQSLLGHPLHRSPRPVAPQQAGLTSPNHKYQQQHQSCQQLVQLQHRASLGTPNGPAPAPAVASAHAVVYRPCHSPGPAADAVVPSAAASADWCKLVAGLESRLDLLLEDRKHREHLEKQVAVLTDQVLLMQQQLTDERRLRDAAEQQLAALSALLRQKLDAKRNDGAAPQQHMVAAVNLDADAVLPVASAEGAVNVECSLAVRAAAPDLALDQAPAHEAPQHRDEAMTGADAPIEVARQELGNNNGPTVGLAPDWNTGSGGHAHDNAGQLPVMKQENHVATGAVDQVTALPAVEHVSAAAAEQSLTPSNCVNGDS